MQTRPKNRKQQILDLALELLQTHGFESFSYQDLSSKLGITKASIHHHFPKKADLGVALCEVIQDWHEREFTRARNLSGSAMDKLDAYVKGTLRYACGDKKICPLSSLQADIASLPEAMRPALKRMDDHELNFIAELLEQGRDNGELQFVGAARSQAILFVLTCKGALQYSRVHGSEVFDAAITQMKTVLLGESA
ncbi:TetR/AcrR family transcriptional regulator [Aestuariicella hydrocarbonica]|uniref:TetR/AcrR family transcriptional regulator n=1 Tax=Pseudomaricurvus hydrocarbonicus TaxID=1470433 RepID=A0A9E5JTH1_9GAMM|nr:TetR/AcrR family transcriptional regulator [Aestuariicella hydrocarbonica]NHO64241.1 TetR/AcrR family transcriptional regulator [Aestuariicella hydrocarbonica]